MATYRSVSTAIWADDTFLALSPEQKFVFLQLHTNPYATACGIYKLQFRTLSFQAGMEQKSYQSALAGLCAAIPDLIAVDWETSEIALLQYPKQTLITAPKKMMDFVEKEVREVQSIYLLRELIARNSATISRPYLAHLRRLQMGVINDSKNHGDMLQLVEDQEESHKTKTLTKTKTKTLSEREADHVEIVPNRGGDGNEKDGNAPTMFEKYLADVQLKYPVLYGSKAKVLLREQHKVLSTYLATLPSEQNKDIMGLVLKVHKDMNKEAEPRDKYGAVSPLLNILLAQNGYPTIEEMAAKISQPS